MSERGKSEASSESGARRYGWIAILLGIFFVLVAQFGDLIGTNPDTGLFDIGAAGVRRGLQVCGAVFVVSGVWALVSNRAR
jgi:hypothetical protein